MDFCRRHVKSDCEELLSRFRRTQSVRFEIFSGIWRDMKFASIFYGTMFHEKRPFARLVLDIASCYFLPPFSFQIRVGGLYLLHSLYHSQDTVPPEQVCSLPACYTSFLFWLQIRLALKDWEEVKKFERDAVNAQHFDVVFILHQLMSCKAIHFTAMPTLIMFPKKRKVERSVLCEDFVERVARPQELINIDLLEELSNVHELYEKMKSSVTSQAESSSMNLTHKDLTSRLRGAVIDFHNWQQTKNGVDEEEVSGEGTSSQLESSKRAELLASIKSKAFGEAAEMCKSRRHRQVEVDHPVSEEESPHPSGRSRISKPSLRARTAENIHISGEVWKEALSRTTTSSLSTLESTAEEKPKKIKRFKWR
ncbi:snRNA-activating protein complex subunit 1 isoform X1 [Oryzias latipes]|uniref:snRNA-activating protein complex subunit 1 isoform X1 n=1 Tax=Oryzias latipes TaxID=8090 RepID=UPI0009DB48CD|nr:snRNA-activating protein complex subunit 1 isoform X1 [Oryzias latipes]